MFSRRLGLPGVLRPRTDWLSAERQWANPLPPAAQPVSMAGPNEPEATGAGALCLTGANGHAGAIKLRRSDSIISAF